MVGVGEERRRGGEEEGTKTPPEKKQNVKFSEHAKKVMARSACARIPCWAVMMDPPPHHAHARLPRMMAKEGGEAGTV